MDVNHIIYVALAIWIAAAFAVALYGDWRGYAFLPVFVCALLMPFPFVLLVITVAPQRGHGWWTRSS